MITIKISPRRVLHPLPIRTGEIEIIEQVRHERRGGKVRTKSKNHRSLKTVWLNPGETLGPVDDSWRNLPDVNAYAKKGWILINTVTVPAPDPLPDPVPDMVSDSNRLESQNPTKDSAKTSRKRSK